MLRLQFSEHPDRGHWDQSLVEDLFGDFGDNVVLIPAKDQAPYINQINQRLSDIPYCVVLIMSDEESQFPYEQLSHPRMKVWVQYPNRKADRYIPAGYSPEKVTSREKTLDWFWGGQVTHEDRYELVKELHKLKGGHLIESQGFTQGGPLKDYLNIMATAKLVPCPRGTVSPDTMRMYDALELGCTPVIRQRDEAFFRKLLGDFPFPVIQDWSDFKDVQPVDCAGWWYEYKRSMLTNMWEDLAWLKSS